MKRNRSLKVVSLYLVVLAVIQMLVGVWLIAASFILHGFTESGPNPYLVSLGVIVSSLALYVFALPRGLVSLQHRAYRLALSFLFVVSLLSLGASRIVRIAHPSVIFWTPLVLNLAAGAVLVGNRKSFINKKAAVLDFRFWELFNGK